MINNVTLVGRLTKDADLRYTSSGNAVATLTLAVNRNFTNQNNEREADFINCVIWKKPAETFASYTRKGSLVAIVGRIQTRSYDNSQGQKVYVTEVVIESFQLLESKQQTDERDARNYHSSQLPPEPRPQNHVNTPNANDYGIPEEPPVGNPNA